MVIYNILKFIELLPIELIDKIYFYTDFLTAFNHKLVSNYTLKYLFIKSKFNTKNSIRTIIYTKLDDITKLRLMFYIQDQLNVSINLEDFFDRQYASGLHPFYDFYKKYIEKTKKNFKNVQLLKRKSNIYLKYKNIL
jgi:hypothetical protein